MKKVLLAGLSFVLVAALSIGMTVAYLTDTDDAVNVMTLGNVSIEQIEQERGANGDLIGFTQDKPAYPVVGTIAWDATKVDVNGTGYLVFDDGLKNVVDKIITVKNTGKTNAFIRTIIAIEAPDGDPNNLIHVNVNNTGVSNTSWAPIEIDGVDYVYSVFTYAEALAPGKISAPSLVQVFLDSKTTNEDCAKFGDTWEIVAISQAVQAEGFSDAATALNAAFEEATPAKAIEWFDTVLPDVIAVSGKDKTAVLAAINNAQPGDIIKLTEDITIAGTSASDKLVLDKPIVLDLNGKTLTTESGWGGIDAKNGCSIKNGTINHTGNTAAIKAFQVESIENVTINVTETAGKTKGGIVVQNGTSSIGTIRNVTINGATNGIEIYHNAAECAIGSITNVTINATQNGIYLNGGGMLGTLTNCNIQAGDTGIRGDLKGLWSINLNLVNCQISGGKYGTDLWDEGPENTGSVVTLNYDANTTFTGNTHDIKITLNAEVKCIYQGAEQAQPCTIYVD